MGGELNNPWQDLKGGRLELEGEAPKQAAQYAADLLEYIEAVQGQAATLTSFEGFPQTIPSARRLEQKFRMAGERLETKIGEHERILIDMGEAFVAAQSAYDGTEEDAENDFDRMRQSSTAADGLAGPPKPEDAKAPKWGGTYREDGAGNYKPPEPLTAAASRDDRDNSPVDTEPVQWMNPQRAYDIWSEMLFEHEIVEAGAMWRWIAGHLDEGFSLFNSNITTLMNGKWEGDGADRARDALKPYRDNGGKLAADALIIGENLHNISGWLWTFTANLTNTDPAHMSDSTRREVDEDSKWAFENWYIPGTETASNAIPMLPETIDPVRGNPRDPGPGNKDPRPGPGPGPLPTSSGGAPPVNTPSPERLTASKAAIVPNAEQQRLRDEAALRNQESPRQQQQAQEQSEQQQPQQLMQQAGQSLQQLGEQVTGDLEGLAQPVPGAGLPGKPLLPAMTEQPRKRAGPGGKGPGSSAAGPGAAGAPPGGAKPEPEQNLSKASRLFPRASITAQGMQTGSATGVAAASASPGAGTPMGGMPMGGAGAGAGTGGQQQKDHQRPDYLDSTEYIEEAVGEAPIVARPVVDQ